MMKLVLLTILVIVAVIYAQTQCQCDLGVYLKEVNGKCSGEVKEFKSPDFGLGCLVVLQDLGLSLFILSLYCILSCAYSQYNNTYKYSDAIEVNACKSTGLNVTAYSDDKCTKELFTEFLPAGGCVAVNIDNHSLALVWYIYVTYWLYINDNI